MVDSLPHKKKTMGSRKRAEGIKEEGPVATVVAIEVGVVVPVAEITGVVNEEATEETEEGTAAAIEGVEEVTVEDIVYDLMENGELIVSVVAVVVVVVVVEEVEM